MIIRMASAKATSKRRKVIFPRVVMIVSWYMVDERYAIKLGKQMEVRLLNDYKRRKVISAETTKTRLIS